MTTEKHTFNAEVAKVLQLVIHSLYTNKDIFIRELVSNASDACDKLRFESQKNPDLLKGELRINIAFDEAAKTITIDDNGIGMDHAELISNLGTIAKSGTGEFLEKLGKSKSDTKNDISLIGQFGVGFYSSFMVANSVEVLSLKAGTNQAHLWKSSGDGEFTIEGANRESHGTTITLHLRDDAEEYLDKHRITHIVQTYSDHITVPVNLAGERINRGTALWMRSKAEVTAEQYKEFYKSISHQVDNPLVTIHGKAEGKLEYNYLLFIPSIKPFDLFHPDRLRRVKLYVKRVYIAEDTVDIIPRYLRFLRGVIDSEDLPLNISRESLQANPVLDKIKKSITTRVLSELKKLGENNPDDYAKFWNNFGAVIKEGLCETMDSKDPILEICRFNSTASDRLVSLDEYIARAKPEQEEIYFLSGTDIDDLKNSPQVEGFIKRGIEVLLFSDSVDDFWVNVAFDYKGKKFKSVTRADIDLDSNEEKPQEPADNLIELFKKELGSKVKDVKYSGKLTESPVCLSIAEGDMDMRMERFLRENKQLPHETAKILEVNKEHPLIKALSGKPNAETSDIINLLFDQAMILEGEKLPNARDFTQRLNKLLEKAVA